ncbi:NRDE family protein [Solibacillus sp.]|uniref:NRDE family protein n=1 Tax=Solibacillus sp. TaxID=1909654 RepID=UPI0033160ED6
MCLIAFAYQSHPTFPLIIIANRDEFYERPTAAAAFWEDAPMILAGRDLKMNGSWLGVSTSGRFAAITNYRDPSRPESGELSRGEIVQTFLSAKQGTSSFIDELREKRALYGGFNVLLYDGVALHHYNNVVDEHHIVPPGVHSVSNATLNTAWPKARFAKEVLQTAITAETVDTTDLISLLANEQIAPDETLPNTGVGIHLERALSAAFVNLPNYGTRCSTAITFQQNGTIQLLERTYEQGQLAFDTAYEIKS